MNDFYVYVYLDPRYSGIFNYGTISFDHKPFYIGKGKNKRCYRAIEPNELQKEKKTIKRNYVEKLYSLGLKPIIIKLFENLTEIESFEKEIELIKTIGRLKYKEGPLTNISEGGDGTSGWKHSKKSRKKISLSKLNKPLSNEHKEALSKSGKESMIKRGGNFTKEHIEKLTVAANSREYSSELTPGQRAKKCKSWLIISPVGRIYTIRLLDDFCKENNLSTKQMRRVSYGKLDNYKGWICKTTDIKYKKNETK